MAVNTQEKRAVGVFPRQENVEAALNELKKANFPIDKVSVIGRDSSEVQELTEDPNKYVRDQTAEGMGKGALTGGALGGLGGLLVGLSSLAIPGLGPIFFAGSQAAIVGTLAGSFYGAVGGTIIGAVLGNGVSNEQANIYSDRLSQGNYLFVVDGDLSEIDRAESILRSQGIKDWGVYDTKVD